MASRPTLPGFLADPPVPFPQGPLTGAHLPSGSNLDVLCRVSIALHCMTATTPRPGPHGKHHMPPAFQPPSVQQPTFGEANACPGLLLLGTMKNFYRGHESRSLHENMVRNCVGRAIPWPAWPLGRAPLAGRDGTLVHPE